VVANRDWLIVTVVYFASTGYGMYFPAILCDYNGMTAYICHRFILTTAFLVLEMYLTVVSKFFASTSPRHSTEQRQLQP